MNNSEYIGISENRMTHIIAVARKCYELAKNEYKMSEENARKMFLMGFIHDFGYEFSESNTEHPGVAVDIISSFNKVEWDQMLFAISTHGNPQKFLGTTYQVILNEADLTIDHIGNTVTQEERCENIKERYGEDSEQYLNVLKMAAKIKNYKEKRNE